MKLTKTGFRTAVDDEGNVWVSKTVEKFGDYKGTGCHPDHYGDRHLCDGFGERCDCDGDPVIKWELFDEAAGSE